MTNKKRWQELAGIKLEETQADKKQLQEGFTNFGMARPGVLGNPFEGRMSQMVVEQDDEIDFDVQARLNEPDISMDAIEKLANAKTAETIKRIMRRIEKNSSKYRQHGSIYRALDSIKQILLSELQLLQEGKGLSEAQFASDPFDDMEDLSQPDLDSDYKASSKTPTMVGSSLDDDFDVMDFDPGDEGLSVRSVDDELDPEYDEDNLGDLFSDRAWPEITDGTGRGIGRKS